MRVAALVLSLVALLVLGVLAVSRGGARDSGHVEPARRTDPRAENAAFLPDAPPPSLPAPPRLAGTPARLSGTPPSDRRSGADPVAPDAMWEAPPLVSAPELVARLLRDGTRIERLWAEYARDASPPVFRRWIQEARTGLEASDEPSPWAPAPTSLSGQVGLRVRLLRAAPGFWRDIGCDTRLARHLFLDDTEVEVIEGALARRVEVLRVEDEHRVSVPAGRCEDVWLRIDAPWPRLPRGRALPLGASVRLRPVVSEDRRYISFGLRLSMAVPDLREDQEASARGVIVRALPGLTMTMPDGGTLLLIGRDVLMGAGRSGPRSATSEEAATRFCLMVHAFLE